MHILPFALERFFAKFEFNTRYLLCASDCESTTISQLLSYQENASNLLLNLHLGYTESTGSPSLRQEISQIYSTISPDEVLVHSGAEEAIFLFMHALLSAGDHLIVHSPCYQSLAEVARSIGVSVSSWVAHEEHHWALDLRELRSLIRPETKAIVVNFPHNPTGFLMPLDEFSELNAIAQSSGITLFSDEVYRELEHHPPDRLPSACDLSPSAVSLGVMSKAYGLAGLRIGWLATHNQHLLSRIASLKDYTTICNSAPSEFLAEIGLKHRQVITALNLQRIHQNLSTLDDFFNRHQDLFDWQRPMAGSVAFPRFLGPDIDEFCQNLVQDTGVLLLPGTLFNDTRNHFRVGYGRANLTEAIAALDSYLKNNYPKNRHL